jgi:hypothetical protein
VSVKHASPCCRFQSPHGHVIPITVEQSVSSMVKGQGARQWDGSQGLFPLSSVVTFAGHVVPDAQTMEGQVNGLLCMLAHSVYCAGPGKTLPWPVVQGARAKFNIADHVAWWVRAFRYGSNVDGPCRWPIRWAGNQVPSDSRPSLHLQLCRCGSRSFCCPGR